MKHCKKSLMERRRAFDFEQFILVPNHQANNPSRSGFFAASKLCFLR